MNQKALWLHLAGRYALFVACLYPQQGGRGGPHLREDLKTDLRNAHHGAFLPQRTAPVTTCAHHVREDEAFVFTVTWVTGDTQGRRRRSTARGHRGRSGSGPTGAGASLTEPTRWPHKLPPLSLSTRPRASCTPCSAFVFGVQTLGKQSGIEKSDKFAGGPQKWLNRNKVFGESQYPRCSHAPPSSPSSAPPPRFRP